MQNTTRILRISHGHHKAAAPAFTLIELLTVIAIIGILAGILIPVTSSVRARSRVAACASNLRQIAIACTTYSVDHKGQFPELPTNTNVSQEAYFIGGTPGGKETWYRMGVLFEGGYITDGRLFYCPTIIKEGNFSYETNWMTSVANNLPTKTFRIGYCQRVLEITDLHPAGSRLTASAETPRILIHDLLIDSHRHPEAPRGAYTGTGTPRGINAAYTDGRVKYYRKNFPGNYWGHALTQSMYDNWEQRYRNE